MKKIEIWTTKNSLNSRGRKSAPINSCYMFAPPPSRHQSLKLSLSLYLYFSSQDVSALQFIVQLQTTYFSALSQQDQYPPYCLCVAHWLRNRRFSDFSFCSAVSTDLACTPQHSWSLLAQDFEKLRNLVPLGSLRCSTCDFSRPMPTGHNTRHTHAPTYTHTRTLTNHLCI